VNARLAFRLLVLATATAFAAACMQAPATKRPTITSAALAEQIRNGKAPLILDVRTPDEYRAGHVPGSVNIPIDELPARLGELPIAKTDEVVVYCERGGRAATGEGILAGAGYAHAVDLENHMQGWRASGLPVE
jgi:rhodanese-related sulfurtransferase